MNLGETIQSLRKEKGFSQEELAEKIGVSRQAVSKWESGASIPEIEKLIELSKLFGVSLHHLLQVAEPKAQVGQRETGTQTEPFPQTDFGQQQKRLEGRQVEEGEAVDFSEAQLASVQEITAQHIAKEGERQRRRWKKTCWLGILLLICTVWALRGQNKDLVKRLDNLENELYRTRLLIDEQTAQIEQTIRIGLEAQTSLVASYQYEILVIDPLADTVTLQVQATPRRYVTGMTASFTFASADFSSVTVSGTLKEQNLFQAQVELPLSDDITVSLLLNDGTQEETQLLDYISGVRSSSLLQFRPSFEGSMGMGSSLGLASEPAGFTIEGDMELYFPTSAQWQEALATPNRPVEAVVEVLHDHNLVETLPVDLEHPLELPDSQVLTAEDWGGVSYTDWTFRFPVEVAVSSWDESQDNLLELRARVTDVYGIVYTTVFRRLQVNADGSSDMYDPFGEEQVILTYPDGRSVLQ